MLGKMSITELLAPNLQAGALILSGVKNINSRMKSKVVMDTTMA